MNETIEYRTSIQENQGVFDVQYEFLIQQRRNNYNDVIDGFLDDISSIDELIQDDQRIIDGLNSEIDRLTNKADGLDYLIAVASGVLTGLIDAFFVGEFNFSDFKADAHKHVNKFIEKYARLRGYKGRGLKGAIDFLEKRFPVAQDNIWKESGISSTKLHHLDDFAHHPTILGLFAAVAVTFFRTATFVDKNGKWSFVLIETDKKKLVKIWAPIIISGILRWLVYLAESKYKEKNSKELPKPLHKLIVALSYSPAIIKVLKVVDNWSGHLVSDMGGSKNTAGGGMGIPGIFISLLKEFSSLPFLKNTNLPKYVSDLYSKGKLDLRAETAIFEFGVKQSIPVILNELLVRSFYFVRHLIAEYRSGDGWKTINWNNVVPWRNRTVTRMLTISSGTFVVVDLADAAIRAATKPGGNPAVFWARMLLRINFVGIGRFALALGTDVYMECKRENLRNDRIAVYNEMLKLYDIKLSYRERDMWVSAKDTLTTLNKLSEYTSFFYYTACASWGANKKDLVDISTMKPCIEKYNPGLLDQITKILS